MIAVRWVQCSRAMSASFTLRENEGGHRKGTQQGCHVTLYRTLKCFPMHGKRVSFTLSFYPR